MKFLREIFSFLCNRVRPDIRPDKFIRIRLNIRPDKFNIRPYILPNQISGPSLLFNRDTKLNIHNKYAKVSPPSSL